MTIFLEKRKFVTFVPFSNFRTVIHLKMQNLRDQVRLLQDLKRQHQINSFRFYTADSQAILLELIAKEIEKWPLAKPIPLDLFSDLANPKDLATDSIEDLCLLYRRIILMRGEVKT